MKDDMSMTITEFLEARITDDEQAAQKAAKWVASGPTPAVTWFGALGDGNIKQFGEGGNHVSTWSPARALAECAAKRAIIKLADDVEGLDYRVTSEWGGDIDGTGEDILKSLASVYADHSDYQQEWAL